MGFGVWRARVADGRIRTRDVNSHLLWEQSAASYDNVNSCTKMTFRISCRGEGFEPSVANQITYVAPRFSLLCLLGRWRRTVPRVVDESKLSMLRAPATNFCKNLRHHHHR